MKEYTLSEIIQALKDGELTINFAKHKFNEGTVEKVIDSLEYSLETIAELREESPDVFKCDIELKYSCEPTTRRV